MTAPTNQEIAELRRLREAATRGPWRLFWDDDERCVIARERRGGVTRGVVAVFEDHLAENSNAALIVAMRNTLTGLLDAYEARGKEIERLRADEVATDG